MPQTITGRFSCDNAFSIWTGTATTVLNPIMPLTVSATAGAIAVGRTLPPVTVTEDDFLYIIAFSDDGGLQGLIGSFTGILTIPLDDPRWRVLATGKNKNPGDTVTKGEIDTALAAALATDWKTPFVGSVNTTASPWGFAVSGIPPSARWVWHNSGKDSSSNAPFGGFNHDEFLIFRIPCREFGIDFPRPSMPALAVERPCKEFQYAVKVVSGIPREGDGLDLVAPGRYFTAINIHNPATCNQVSFRWKVADAKPAGQPFGHITRFRPLSLRPDQAVEIDNPQIFDALGLEKAGSFVKGFAVIESPCELDVVAVYTAGSAGPSPAAAASAPAMHTERVAPRVIEACREDLRLNLSTGVAGWQVRSAVSLTGAALPVGAPRAANVIEDVDTSWKTQAGSRWISVRGNAKSAPDFAAGYYTFQTCFSLCAGFESAKLNLSILADDGYVVWVNDTLVSANPEPGNGGGNAQAIAVPEPALLPGRNCLTIAVRNDMNDAHPNPVGLNVQASLVAPRGKCSGCGCCSDHDDEAPPRKSDSIVTLPAGGQEGLGH